MGYTPGHGATAVAFMAARSLARNAPGLAGLLAPGTRVLDLGCGPGTITAGIAARVAPGEVVAVDAAGSQVLAARRLGHHLRAAGFTHVRLRARYEHHDPPAGTAEYLAERLEGDGAPGEADALRAWARRESAVFAQCWVDAEARA